VTSLEQESNVVVKRCLLLSSAKWPNNPNHPDSGYFQWLLAKESLVA